MYFTYYFVVTRFPVLFPDCWIACFISTKPSHNQRPAIDYNHCVSLFTHINTYPHIMYTYLHIPETKRFKKQTRINCMAQGKIGTNKKIIQVLFCMTLFTVNFVYFTSSCKQLVTLKLVRDFQRNDTFLVVDILSSHMFRSSDKHYIVVNIVSFLLKRIWSHL